MNISANWIFLAITIGSEYELKQLFENIVKTKKFNSCTVYLVYRLFHVHFLMLILKFLFTCTYPLLIAFLLVFLGSMLEISLNILFRKIKYTCDLNLSIFYILPMIILFIFNIWILNKLNLQFNTQNYILGTYLNNLGFFKLNYDNILITISIMIILSNSTGYIIRWLLHREYDNYLIDFFLDRYCVHHEVIELNNKEFEDKHSHKNRLPDMIIKKLSELGISDIPHQSEQVRELAASSDKDENKSSILCNFDRITGILERWLIVGCVLTSQYIAIGLIITIKSFDQIFKGDFSIGTLYSISIAIFFGLILSYII